MRNWLGRALLAITGAVIALLLGELALRVFRPQRLTTPITSHVFRNDAETDYVFRPDLDRVFRRGGFEVRIFANSLGISDEELPPEKAPGELRVLVLGDSFTWGGYTGDVERGFASLLEKRLTSSERFSQRVVRVVNAGVPGYGTRQELGMYRRLRSRIRPDLVILGFYLGNDFLDNLELTAHRVVGDYLVSRGSVGPTTGLRVFFYHHSHLYRLLELWNPVTSRASPYAYGERLTYFDDPRNEFEAARRETERHLEELLAATRRDGAPLLVALIPGRLGLDRSLARRKAESHGLGLEDWSPTRPQEAMLTWLSQTRVRFVDITPVFSSARGLDYEAIFSGFNGHISHAGNELIAEALAERILELESGPASDSAGPAEERRAFVATE